VVYCGSVPGQQVVPALEWLLSKAGGARKKIYLLGSDYIFPRISNLVGTRFLKTKTLAPVAEKYVPLGHKDFAAVVRDIKKTQPDVIVNSIIGDSNLGLFNELAAQGLTADRLPVLNLSIDEEDLRGPDPKILTGHLAACRYFQSVNTPANKEFVERFKAKYGKDRVTTDAIESAYSAVYLWKLACEKAKSFDVDKVRAALPGLEFDAPGGKIKVDEKNQHVWKKFRIGRINKDRQFDVVYASAEWLKPEPYRFIKEG
jgi:urea transport system substrate-binding protein